MVWEYTLFVMAKVVESGLESRAPQQARSRKTLEALLQATVRTLEAHGLEACTLPRVAEAAKVAPATVYRRFADKDALMRAALLDVLEGGVTDKAVVEKALARGTLAETAERVVVEMLRRCRERPRLLQATSLFIAAHAGTEFAETAAKLVAADVQVRAAVLLKHQDRIRHPEPERAAVFAVLQARAAVEAVVFDPEGVWKAALSMGDKQVVAEVSRAMVGYLRRKP